MNLYLTAKGRYVGTQAEARADGKGWTPEEVPTDKAGLIAYLNGVTSPPAGYMPNGEPVAGMVWVDEAAPLTSADVDAMFAPASQRTYPALGVDELTTAIMDLDGHKLGNVLSAALERAAQIRKEI